VVEARGHTYLVDTDVLEHIRQRNDSAAIYEALVALVHARRLFSVRQVLDGELKKFATPHEIFYPLRGQMLIEQYLPEIGQLIERLGNEFAWLWEQTGGKNPDAADPWLAACGAHYGYTVVADEGTESPKKLPAACRLIGARCIHGPHLLVECRIVREIRPEDISTSAFYRQRT
jgi:hypothetical protein